MRRIYKCSIQMYSTQDPGPYFLNSSFTCCCSSMPFYWFNDGQWWREMSRRTSKTTFQNTVAPKFLGPCRPNSL